MLITTNNSKQGDYMIELQVDYINSLIKDTSKKYNCKINIAGIETNYKEFIVLIDINVESDDLSMNTKQKILKDMKINIANFQLKNINNRDSVINLKLKGDL